jgi:hypothetical protein
MRCMVVLAIANRLCANQALGDMVERRARIYKLGTWSAGVVAVSIPPILLRRANRLTTPNFLPIMPQIHAEVAELADAHG